MSARIIKNEMGNGKWVRGKKTKKTHHSSLITHHPHSGFTLIELMVTITIIAILASIGLVVYSTVQKTARISKRVQDLQAIRTAIELYKTSTGNYPNQNAAVTCTNSATALAALAPTYMPVVPSDPSGGSNCYRYQSDAASLSNEYKIWTFNNDMSANDYNTQLGMIDPNRDGTGGNCTYEAIPSGTTGTSTYAWAYYTTGACGY